MRRLTVLVLSLVLAEGSLAAVKQDVEAFFDDFIQRTNVFDADVSELYDSAARIITLRDGTQRLEMTGSEWKELLIKVMPIAKQRGDTSVFSNVKISEHEGVYRISATRTSNLKCSKDRNYHLDVKSTEGGWQIIEEYSETVSLPRCKPSKKLAASLSQLREAIAPHLPLDLDSDTRLESVDVVGSVVIYNQRLHTISASELDTTKLIPLLQEIGVKNACGDAGMRALVEQGTTVSYSYVDRDGYEVTKVNISPGWCP